jgi:hypothetical protein
MMGWLWCCGAPPAACLELPEHGILGVFIDTRLVCDVFSPAGWQTDAQQTQRSAFFND